MTDRKPATDPDYLASTERMRDPVSRQTLALTLMTVPTLFGALALSRLGIDSTTLTWVGVFVIACGAAGGWIHHPVRRFRARGAAAGMMATGGALLAMYLYVNWRGGDRNIVLVEELLIALAIGAAPGLYLYYSLLRHEHVEPWEQPSGTAEGRPDGR